ncbi:ATPase RavA [Novipirellula aureliae]|uniref:ATPase RavA n=1 Tax=Novipirellula aureliae TaxID=2527966 RepID=A0A5C6E7T7_9BACT|nr:MoxR family ATPase [Novipirellula aureliae]TWU45713.1 ATPase RavA [Novipirellula aureliae]
MTDTSAKPAPNSSPALSNERVSSEWAPDESPASAPFARSVIEQVGHTVVGQSEVVERVLIALLTGGHLLLEGVPGIAKTLLVQAVGKAIDLQFKRVQFTIDLLPSDILGSEILDQKSGQFHIHKGPVFTNLLLADEINRASPKVQSALLEAMQERRVSIGDETHALPAPFLVIATQNPVEQAGTFELPEAQLDRFMMCHRLRYPTPSEETEVVKRALKLKLERQGDGAVPQSMFDAIGDEHTLSVRDLTEAMTEVQTVHVSDVFVDDCIKLVGATRSHKDIVLGCSPRAALSLVNASRARAFIYGRSYVIPEDLFTLAEDVILHRVRLSYEAIADGRTPQSVLDQLLGEML